MKKEGRIQRYKMDQRNKQDEKNIPPGQRYLSLASVVCCQIEVSATGRSLVQRSPAECGVAECDGGTS
jgi:hypothetical protein